jgi:cytoskeleton protein RodZ
MNDHGTAGSPDGLAHPLYLLRQAREARGMHIAILSTALKVPVKKLEALEAGRYEELPGLTFARALASSACRHLKVDPEHILAQIPVAATPLLGPAGSGIDTPFIRAEETRVQTAGWLSRPALLLAGVLVAGALLLVFWPQAMPLTDITQTEVPVAAANPASAEAPASSLVTEPVVVSAPAVSDAVADVAAPMAGARSPLPLQPTAAAVAASVNIPPPTGSLMSIRATSESWVEVSQVGGTVLLRRLLKTGEVVDFSAPPPYAVLLGRAEAAEVTVRGQRLDTTAFVRNSVARFEVK